ncbi:MAG: chromosome segregation protein SMC [Thiohalomonadales bacterium]
MGATIPLLKGYCNDQDRELLPCQSCIFPALQVSCAFMRLTSIKIAGFKSFVDPTTIPLPSNLIGVVGPNGCGKSNVIDAVRWVMGESSAKHLRGESMADVIFNGSSTRKPVGQASVELLFDNSDGTIAGEYAKYNEISVRRTITRDGQSVYYQNGTRCRRRDITDIFLGTGLGPRGYSIIEQGMISRLIEARPEDLRVFLEEAAGISKYKERRKETETRIRHTRENMERLTDLRDELEKQLAHLQRQSKTAEKFKLLKQEERLLKAQLTALRWNSLDEQIKLKDNSIKGQENLYEAEVAKLRGIEADIEKMREQHVETSETFNEVQAQFYSVGADIARVEQSIQHGKERQQQHRDDLKQAEISLVEAQTHISADRNKLDELSTALQTHQPALQLARGQETESAALLEYAEEQMHTWQSSWEEFNLNSAEPARRAEVERTKLEHLEHQIIQYNTRTQKLNQELQQQAPEALHEEIRQLAEQKESISLDLQKLESVLQGMRDDIDQTREKITELDSSLNDVRGQLQDYKGRQSSLQALQQAALGKKQNKINDWLQANGLADRKRLAESIQVSSGWEHATEFVLDSWLEAVCVDSVEHLTATITDLDQGLLNLFGNEMAVAAPVSINSRISADRLSDKVSANWNLHTVIGGIYCVESIEDAKQLVPHLEEHESVITKLGVWLGKNWLRINKAVDERAGVLQREQELSQVGSGIEECSAVVEEINEQLALQRSSLKQYESNWEQQQFERQQLNRKQSEFEARINAKTERVNQMRLRSEAIQVELEEIANQFTQNEEQVIDCRRRLQDAIEKMQLVTLRREALQSQRDEIQQHLQQSRQTARIDREQANELNIKINTITTEVSSIEQNQSRMQQQHEKMSQRQRELEDFIEQSREPLQALEIELEQYLSTRLETELRLTEARRSVESLDHALRERSSERTQIEQASQSVRSELDQMRLDWQESNVRRKTLEEALEETDYRLQTLFEEMEEGANIDEWQQRVDKTAQRLQRLGPINLAAIDEFKTQAERKEYLDAQHTDLFDALETLETAIKKIDRETRQRFKDTYDEVNDGFKAMFPKLFGGGHAYLELTGEDLLDTGVTVMARPPGKRNSTIQLLSGGEKALTAVSLVFAIFQLNPAPFCMLDEVDAPLDDANVGRFCSMVEEMSEKVQFIFITHNKITMELAQQLNGVTMYEPGVSRLVAVDVSEAVEMALA